MILTLRNGLGHESQAEVSTETVKQAISEYGILLVADWEGGGSDAVNFDIYNEADFWKEFPKSDPEIIANPDEVKRFFAGELHDFRVRWWIDGNQVVTDTIHVPSDLYEDVEFVRVK